MHLVGENHHPAELLIVGQLMLKQILAPLCDRIILHIQFGLRKGLGLGSGFEFGLQIKQVKRD